MSIRVQEADRDKDEIVSQMKNSQQEFGQEQVSGARRPSTSSWDKARVAKLSPAEVKSLRLNALNRGEAAIVAVCDAYIAERQPAAKMTPGQARTATDRQAEKEAAPLLKAFANEMLALFDLDEDRARALSVGTYKFVPHAFVSKAGSAKIGGAQKLGIVGFDRFISYRMKHETFEFSIRKLLASDELVFEVAAPQSYLSDPQPIAQLRPYAPETITNDSSRFGQHYADFNAAADVFRGILTQVAPKLT